jgi:flagellar basal body-associated protein FliL
MTMRKKTLIIVITIIIIALIGGVIYGVLSAKNKKENPDEPINTFKPKNSGVVTVPKIEGNTELSEDRKELLDENIVRAIAKK